MTTNRNHHLAIIDRAIDLEIDNSLDELHDRDRDDYADLIEPHLDSLRALCKLQHAAACDIDHNDPKLDDDDELDDAAMNLSNDPDSMPCYTHLNAAIYTFCYTIYER